MNFEHNAYEIRHLFDIMKDVVTDVNMVFDKNGASIRAIDPEKVINVNMVINKPSSYSFIFQKPIYIGVNMQNMYKIIRSVTNVHRIQLEIGYDLPNVLKIVISHPSTGVTSTTSLYSLDIPKNQPLLPTYSFDAACRLPTMQMQRTIKDLSHGSKKLTISSSNVNSSAQLWFSSKGTSYVYTTSIAISPSKDGLQWLYKNKDVLSGEYITKYIERFCKPTVGKTIELSFHENGLLNISYPLLALGELSMTIAPIVNEDIENTSPVVNEETVDVATMNVDQSNEE